MGHSILLDFPPLHTLPSTGVMRGEKGRLIGMSKGSDKQGAAGKCFLRPRAARLALALH